MSPHSTIAHYRIISKLGEGGMGEVYRATDTKLNREVAIKVIPTAMAEDPDRMARFEREAQVLASLNHPNIAAIYGVEERALVLELVEGPTLAERIAQGPIPIEEAVPIARQIAEALEYAHEKAIIHRDLKPANIKISPEGRAKVLDFGRAKALASDAPAADPASSPTLTMRATMAGMILGTAGYMSPEQAKGKPADRRADIWAFGILLAEMLTGRPMYTGETGSEVLAAVIMKEPAIPGSAPAHIRQLLRRCLDRDPTRRLQAIGEARIALEGPTPPDVPQTAPATNARRAPILPWAIAALALIAAGWSLTRPRSTVAPPVVRFQLNLFDKAVQPQFEVSPDGRYLAMSAVIDGPRRLWVRALDSTELRAVAGTDGATYPTWSPDSRSLAFFAQGKLKKIAASGGAAQALCDAADGRGVAWGSDGTLVFSPGDSGQLFRISSSGGTPAAISKPPAAGQRAYDRYPSFVADSRRFLFLRATGVPETSGVYLGSLDGMAPVRILPEQTNAYFTADPSSGRGWIVSRRESSVVAQAFDPSRSRLSGEPVQLAASVGTAGNTSRGAFSVSVTGTLAVWPNQESGDRQLVWVDRAGHRLSAVTQPFPIVYFAFSTDEKRIAMILANRQGSGIGDVWIQELDRGAPSRFTFSGHADGRPLWSPDGRTIAYGERPSAVQSRIYRKPADGSSREELLAEAAYQMVLRDWSPDGKYALYSMRPGAVQMDLFLLPMGGSAGTARKPVGYQNSPANESRGAFSPDSRWVAFTSDESGESRVYVQAVPASGPKWPVSAGAGDSGAWRRDGRELYYLASDRKLMAVPVETGPGGFHAGVPRALFETPAQTEFQPSADGKRFLMRLPPEGESGVAPIEIVVNWPLSLRKPEAAQ
jgi:Tol biopolymer transport system component